MISIKTKKKISSFFILILSVFFLHSCSKQINKIEYQEACYFEKINNKEILICDEERMNKVKVQIQPYSKEFMTCDKFEYSTKIDGETKVETGIKCPTKHGYQIIK